MPTVPCPNSCCSETGKGVCNKDTGECKCAAAYGGLDCCKLKLPCCDGCEDHGTCDSNTGRCKCDDGWGNLNTFIGGHAKGKKCCSAKLCPLDCRSDEGHGVCNVDTGTCECDASWTGAACTEPAMPCPDACSGHGECDKQTGECKCKGAWHGIDCAIPYVPCNCSALDNSTVHGVCDTTVGVMHCDPGPYAGKCCTPLPCFRNCTGEAHGLCDESTGLCKCKRAWEDADCGTPKCGDHGYMLPDGSCHGDPDYYAPIAGGICDRVGSGLCRPDIRCVADGTEADTCSKRAVGWVEPIPVSFLLSLR